MELLTLFAVGAFGLAFGSFISAYTYRFPREISISSGRSFCDSCKKKIAWYDNIPVVSFLLLSGKSRCCGKKISYRYPLIETLTGSTFALIYYLTVNCGNFHSGNFLCTGADLFGPLTLPYLLLVSAVLIAILVVDLEHQIIPDELVFTIFTATFLVYLISDYPLLLLHLLTGFAVALFFLILHLATLGKGMGLGDVKLVLSLGFVLGWPLALPWLVTSFVLGAVVGVGLILIGKAKFGKHIAFGPFLILAFFAILFFSNTLLKYFPTLTLPR